MGISQGAGGAIQGTMQLFSIEKGVSQTLQGHTGCFHTIAVPGRADKAQVLCFQEKKPDQPAKLFVMEVGRDKDAPGGVFRLAPVAIPVPADAPNDFPVSMLPSTKHDILFMITKMGYLYLFDVFSGSPPLHSHTKPSQNSRHLTRGARLAQETRKKTPFFPVTFFPSSKQFRLRWCVFFLRFDSPSRRRRRRRWRGLELTSSSIAVAVVCRKVRAPL